MSPRTRLRLQAQSVAPAKRVRFETPEQLFGPRFKSATAYQDFSISPTAPLLTKDYESTQSALASALALRGITQCGMNSRYTSLWSAVQVRDGHAVHFDAPAALTDASRKMLIHISALGLTHPHRSRFLTRQLAGETALNSSGADYFIVRPSLLKGKVGFGAKWIRCLACLPILSCPQKR